MRRSRAGRCTARASIASYGRNAIPLKRSESRSEQFLIASLWVWITRAEIKRQDVFYGFSGVVREGSLLDLLIL